MSVSRPGSKSSSELPFTAVAFIALMMIAMMALLFAVVAPRSPGRASGSRYHRR